MPTFVDTPDYSHTRPARLGILLTNLGTPDHPTSSAVRRYLAEFLSDPRVIETPRIIWWPILHGVILRTRPRRSAAAYKKIWTAEGSPLLVNAQAQADAIREGLNARLPERAEVALGMRYGKPSIDNALQQLRQAGVTRLLALPLYPQYSASTTASTFDALSDALQGWRWIPELRFVSHYHDKPGYISALATSIREHWQRHGKGNRLLFSFHGLPQSYLEKGDPYHCQCHKTARLVAEQLQLDDADWQLGFQSRVGTQQWLKPYTDELLSSWGFKGMDTVDVICPGFSADCLETLEEIAMQNADLFREAGGGSLRYVPALNARTDHIEFLINLIQTNFSGWPEADADYQPQQALREAEQSRARALALGARR